MTYPEDVTAARAALAPTGTLRAIVNLGNPVLAQGDQDSPRGLSVGLADLLATQLDVPLALTCVAAARDSVAAIESEAVDIGFVAVDPDRAQTLAFTDPYVVIEALFVVPEDSPLRSPEDVDVSGVRVGVKRGSAYDLHLTRELARATVVRGEEGVDIYLAESLEAGAGIRGPVTEFVARQPGHRALEPAFMQIRQAIAIHRGRDVAALEYLRSFVADVVANGVARAALVRSGLDPALAARST